MENSLRNVNIKGVRGEIEFLPDNRIANWQKLKFGMFIHWGIYSQLGGIWNNRLATEGYSEQIQMWEGISKEEYLNQAEEFFAENFNPQSICQLAIESGMKYIVLTTKHHDGFCMFDTNTTDYNIVKQTPFGKDALLLLAKECRKYGLGLGIYYSLVDWNEGHSFDPNNNNPIPYSMEQIIIEQLKELLTCYGSIVELWFDMSSPTIEQSERLVSLVHEYQPEVMINSRIWNNSGDFRTLSDNELPNTKISGAWQTPASINHATWGYRSWQDYDVFSERLTSLLEELIKVCSSGGNYLLNIGPRGDGSIVEYEKDMLRALGEWVKRHPGLINGNMSTHLHEHNWGHIMVHNKELFLYLTTIPSDNKIVVSGLATPVLNVVEDFFNSDIIWKQNNNELIIDLSNTLEESFIPVLKVQLSDNLYIIPEKVVSSEGKTWEISCEDISYSFNYVDEGNYSNTKLSTVSLKAFLVVKENQELWMKFNGSVDHNNSYSVTIGEQKRVVTGKQLQEESIGGFFVQAFEVIPVIITLAEPLYKEKDINVNVKSIVIYAENEV